MITRIIVSLAIVMFLTVGCGADYGRVKVGTGGFEVEAGTDKREGKRTEHCPPGHKKKGWCK